MTQDPAELHDLNRGVIAEFRENEGRIGGRFEDVPMLLLHSVGARSGAERINPIVYQALDDNFAVFASLAGAPTNPAWFHNLVANPEVTIEVGTDTIDVTARVTSDEEREPIWQRQKAAYSAFVEYEKSTTRQIPVIILERR